MSKESLLKLLHDFHFDALTKEPFLCDFDGNIGIYYTIKHPLYGKLSRIFYSDNILELKNFLSLYRFYIENNNDVSVSFDNYKVVNPLVTFYYHGKKILIDDIAKIKNEPVEQEDRIYLQKVLRSALLLQEVIVAKIKLQRDCHDSVLRFSKEYYSMQKKVEEKIVQYDSKLKKENVESIAEASFYDYTLDYLETKKENVLSLSLTEVKNYIQNLLKLLKKIDESITFIQDKYELLCYPLRIDLAQLKLDYLDTLLKKKGKFFGKKKNVLENINEIEQNHSLSHVISFKQYNNNEMKRTQEKYALIDDIDIRTLGDFFIEFDNLEVSDIQIPKINKLSKKSEKSSISYLENAFEKRALQDQATLVLYHSMLKPICYYIEAKQDKIADEYVNDFLQDLKLSSNSMIRLRYFKDISSSSVEACKKSIINVMKKIESVEHDVLLEDLVVYFRDSKVLSNRRFLEASNCLYLAPCQILGEQDVVYVCTIKKGSFIYYIQKELQYDMEAEDTFVLKQRSPYFLIDTQKNEIKGQNSDIITVVEYSGHKKEEKGFIFVEDVKSVKVNQIREIFIERKE